MTLIAWCKLQLAVDKKVQQEVLALYKNDHVAETYFLCVSFSNKTLNRTSNNKRIKGSRFWSSLNKERRIIQPRVGQERKMIEHFFCLVLDIPLPIGLQTRRIKPSFIMFRFIR